MYDKKWLEAWIVECYNRRSLKDREEDKMENEQGEKFKDQPHLGHCKKEKMLEKKKYDKQS